MRGCAVKQMGAGLALERSGYGVILFCPRAI